MSVPGEIFVSPKQMAEKLGIHRTTVYSMVREGKLMPPIKLGSRSVWRLSEVDAWMLAQGSNSRL